MHRSLMSVYGHKLAIQMQNMAYCVTMIFIISYDIIIQL